MALLLIPFVIYIYRGFQKREDHLTDNQMSPNDESKEAIVELTVDTIRSVSSNQEELDAIETVMDYLFGSELSLPKISLDVSEQNRYLEIRKQVIDLGLYDLCMNFIDKFAKTLSPDKIKEFADLLRNKGCHFSDWEDVIPAVSHLSREKDYEELKQEIITGKENSLKGIVTNFVLNEENNFETMQNIKRYQKQNLPPYIDEYTFSSVGVKAKVYGSNEKGELIEKDYREILGMIGSLGFSICDFVRILKENNIYLTTFMDGKIGYKALLDMLIKTKKRLDIDRLEKRIMSKKAYFIEDVDNMSGYEFESFLTRLFKKMGYIVEQTKLSGDQGADLLARKHGEKIAVQAKRAGSKIGNSAIQEIVASLKHYEAQKGIVVTNSGFTKSAKELAKSNRIELMDRKALDGLLKKYL